MIFNIVLLFIFCNTKELFEEYYKEANEIMSKMSTKQKIGQMLFSTLDSISMKNDNNYIYPGGLILLEEDFKWGKKEEIIKQLEDIQKQSNDIINLPLGLAVKEEGGEMNTISQYFRKEKGFPSSQQIYNESKLNGILKIEEEKRNLLRKFKININLAPFADILTDLNDPIYRRTLGQSQETTEKYIEQFVESYEKDRFSCCAKYFPRYSNDNNRTEEDFENNYKIYRKAISKNVPMILMSDENFGEENSASLSEKFHKKLRDDLEYSGLILTTKVFIEEDNNNEDESLAVLAIESGNDIIFTHNYNRLLDELNKEAEKIGESFKGKIDMACKRIIAWKIKYLTDKKEQGNEEDDNTVLVLSLSVGGIIIVCTILYLISKFFICKDSRDNSQNPYNNESSGLLS